MNIESQIRNYINNNLIYNDDDSIQFGDNDSFLKQHILDSTGVMELILFVEESFNIEIDDSELIPENFDSVNNISSYIRTKMAENRMSLNGH